MKRFLRIGLSFLLVYQFAVSTLFAQLTDLGLDFMSLPATTRSLALGGATASLQASNPSQLFESPALLEQSQSMHLDFSYNNLMGDRHLSSIAYAQSLLKHGTWGVGLRMLNYGSFEGRDYLGAKTGDFSVNDILLQGSYSHVLSANLRLGMSVKFCFSNLAEYKRYGLASDIALNAYSDNQYTSFGLSLMNVGSVFTPHLSTPAKAMPWDIRLGLSQRLSHAPIRIHLTAYHLRPRLARELSPEKMGSVAKILRHLMFGFEFLPRENFWIALGFNPRVYQDFSQLKGTKFSGFSLGLGLNQDYYDLGLSLRAYDPSFWSVMTTLSIHIDAFRPKNVFK